MSTAMSDRPSRLHSRRRFLGVDGDEPAQYGDGRSAAVDAHWLKVQRRAMACAFEITLDQADAGLVPAAQAALNQVDAIEAQLTVFRESSDIVDLNRRAADESVACSADLFALLSRCAELHQDTEGAFDITSTPLSRCWGFLEREGRLPSDLEIQAARRVVGMPKVRLDRRQSSVKFLERGVELNLGAVGKGHALDRMAASLRDDGVTHALLSAGRSSLLAIGGRNRGWPIDIVSPRRTGAMARVWLRDMALGTSGAGEQFVIVEGQRYGHVIDPRTGRPAGGMLSASVICSRAADADALSTAFLVGGPLLAQRYCDAHDGVLVLLTPDDESETTLVIGKCAGVEIEDV